jgi:uncharacterized protein (DUF433 family)
MLLLATSSLPDNDDWLYELELDGYRAIGFKSGGRVQLRAFRQQIHRSLRERSPKSTVFSAAAWAAVRRSLSAFFLWNTEGVLLTKEIDWTGCPIIQRDPLKLHGAPNINGLRITPDTIVGNFEAGLDIEEIHEQFPGVPVEDIRTVLSYAAEHGSLSRPVR